MALRIEKLATYTTKIFNTKIHQKCPPLFLWEPKVFWRVNKKCFVIKGINVKYQTQESLGFSTLLYNVPLFLFHFAAIISFIFRVGSLSHLFFSTSLSLRRNKPSSLIHIFSSVYPFIYVSKYSWEIFDSFEFIHKWSFYLWYKLCCYFYLWSTYIFKDFSYSNLVWFVTLISRSSRWWICVNK